MFFKQIISIILSLILFIVHSSPVYAINTFGLSIPEINIQTKIDDAGKFIGQTKDQISKTASNVQLSNISLPSFSNFLEEIKNIEMPDIAISQADVRDLYSSLISALSNANKVTQQAYQLSSDIFDNVDLYSLVIGGSATYGTINQSLQKIPQDFSQLLQEMPKVADRMRRAGMKGDKRSYEEAFQLFKKMPIATLLENSERKVRTWLATNKKEGSHIISRANGGSAEPNNIFWENSKVNRARGSADAKQIEIIHSMFRNGAEAIVQNSKTILKLGTKATVTAVLIDEIAENGIHAIELAREEITLDQFIAYIHDSAIKTAISTAAFYTLTMLAISIFPAISVPLFSSPLIVTASQIFLGTRLAIPLISKLATS
jgi:hypothetical protein